jgi:hypothetical protein
MLINKMALPRKKHYHILEVILGYLANAQMPLKFKDEVLEAKYLINMLPSEVINNDTHVHCLLALDLIILSCVFLVAHVDPICAQTTKANSISALRNAFFLDIVLAIKVLNA